LGKGDTRLGVLGNFGSLFLPITYIAIDYPFVLYKFVRIVISVTQIPILYRYKTKTKTEMIPINNHPRIVGILAARDYILSRTPAPETVQELKQLGIQRAQQPCLHGINLSMKLSFKNSLGNPLPSISL
jgi:hypothetical protein